MTSTRTAPGLLKETVAEPCGETSSSGLPRPCAAHKTLTFLYRKRLADVLQSTSYEKRSICFLPSFFLTTANFFEQNIQNSVNIQSSKTDPGSNVQYFEAKTHQLQSPSSPRPAVLTFSLPTSKNVTQDFQKTDSCFNDNSGCYFSFPFFNFVLPLWSLFLSRLSAATTQLSKTI